MRLFLLILLFVVQNWPVAATAQTGNDALARRLLNSQGCKGCHRIDGEGAAFAPDLSKVGGRLDKEQLRNRLINPQHRHAHGRIADFSHLRSEELDTLVTFLSQRR